MSYVNPKVYFADPTAFQKGFQGSFNEYIKIQREQIQKQQESDKLREEEFNEFSSGLYNSDTYSNASKSVRDALSDYFKDVQRKYLSLSSQTEKTKLLGDSLAEAKEFVDSYGITNQYKNDTIANDYLGKPIQEFIFSEGPAVAEYRQGKLGITYGDKSNFISKENLFHSKPTLLSETEALVSEKTKSLIEEFNKNNKASANSKQMEILEKSKNFSINNFVESLDPKEITAYITSNKIKLSEGQTAQEAIAADLEERLQNTRVYNESKVLMQQQIDAGVEEDIEKASKPAKWEIDAEALKRQQQKLINNNITQETWDKISGKKPSVTTGEYTPGSEQSIQTASQLASEYDFKLVKTLLDESGEKETGFLFKDNKTGEEARIYKNFTLEQVIAELKKAKNIGDNIISGSTTEGPIMFTGDN